MPTRRTPPSTPHVGNMSWEQARGLIEKALEELNRKHEAFPAKHASTHMGGDDSVEGTRDPSPITIGAEGNPGDPEEGFAPAGHVHDTTGITLEDLAGADSDSLNGNTLLKVHDPVMGGLLRDILWRLEMIEQALDADN